MVGRFIDSPLQTPERAETDDDLDQVGLGLDDGTEVLVRAGDLVDHTGVLAAHEPGGLRSQVVDGEGALRRRMG